MSLSHTRRSISDIWKDIRWGVMRVAPFVIFFGGIALVAELLGIKFAGLNIQRTVFIYVTFGLTIGVVVGGLRPVASTSWGSGLIGAVVGVPLALYIRILAVGANDWRVSDIVICSASIGCCIVCAIAFRRGYARAEEKSRTEGSL